MKKISLANLNINEKYMEKLLSRGNRYNNIYTVAIPNYNCKLISKMKYGFSIGQSSYDKNL